MLDIMNFGALLDSSQSLTAFIEQVDQLHAEASAKLAQADQEKLIRHDEVENNKHNPHPHKPVIRNSRFAVKEESPIPKTTKLFNVEAALSDELSGGVKKNIGPTKEPL